jgi:hypothetical protein
VKHLRVLAQVGRKLLPGQGFLKRGCPPWVPRHQQTTLRFLKSRRGRDGPTPSTKEQRGWAPSPAVLPLRLLTDRNTTPFCLKSPKLQKGGAPLKEGRLAYATGSASQAEDLRFLKARISAF